MLLLLLRPAYLQLHLPTCLPTRLLLQDFAADKLLRLPRVPQLEPHTAPAFLGRASPYKVCWKLGPSSTAPQEVARNGHLLHS